MDEILTPRWTGVVRGVYTAPSNGAPVEARAEARAVAGVGLDGDRHALGDDESAQLSLIEAEAIAAANRDYGLSLAEGEARRNVVTAGVPLRDLVGREFRIGAVRLRGTQLCEPCVHLREVTGKNLLRALARRGGLYADILSDGVIRPGDPVTPAA